MSSFSGANGGATPGVSSSEPKVSARAFSGNGIQIVDHLGPIGHGQWKCRGPATENPHEDAAIMQAMSSR